ncbi:hypothetical protein [Streptacidiphilus jiangxiensis]|uniref:Uncharacterized protein n=1 Tax=Streptacidiphilus jiangxiensis TaxID=235985 RepID=A0A1H7ZTX9_STRJI|nr:hypothetical protein [Streptacidiphilus jiangxiensis]SEM62092.1 hypothetical protein SAMN05414137_13816 [Streptacidiphilus jiangxiensis]
MTTLKAEYGVATAVLWHVVPDADGATLCHRLLSSIAEVRPITDADGEDIEVGQLCPRCRTALKRAPRGTDGQSQDLA